MGIVGITLNRDKADPLHRQLYEALRNMILQGQLKSGTRLPPTRALCLDLNISRSTVIRAVEQLAAEGYIIGRQGAGTFVSDALPESMLQIENQAEICLPFTKTTVTLSKRGQMMTAPRTMPQARAMAFQPGIPALDHFPFNIWRKLMSDHWRHPDSNHLIYGEAAGYCPLRAAIADHVRVTRGIHCQSEQVIITTGTQQSLYLAIQLLTDPGEMAWMENPGYTGTQTAFTASGIKMIPVAVDHDGLMVEEGLRQAPQAKIAYVTPSHQYPIGAIMSLQRRLALLQWAEQQHRWILEDDYDSEFRFAGHPLAALYGLDKAGRTIYMATFSKVLFPEARLGYIIVPPALVSDFTAARTMLDRGAVTGPQVVLDAFIREGHFVRHIRQMRTLYAQRQAVLIEAIHSHCHDWLTVNLAPAGLHLVGWLPENVDDRAIEAAMKQADIDTPALSTYSLTPQPRGGLVLGYGATDEGNIRATVRRMAQVWQSQ